MDYIYILKLFIKKFIGKDFWFKNIQIKNKFVRLNINQELPYFILKITKNIFVLIRYHNPKPKQNIIDRL